MDQEKAKEMLSKKYYKKMGIWHEEKEGNEGTHYICDADLLDEIFNDFSNTIKEKESEIRQLKAQIEQNRLEYNQRLDTWKRKYEGEAKAKMYEAEKLKKEAEIKSSENENLCKTLLRINKENANAKRKIKPKKTHPGYIVKDRETFNYLFSSKMNHAKNFEDSVNLYKCVIQTPYDIRFQEDDIINFFQNDLKENKINLGVDYKYHSNILTVNLREFLAAAYENDYEKQTGYNKKYHGIEDIFPCNQIFTATMRTNSRDGFWELIFVTNFEPILNEYNYPFTTDPVEDLNPTGTDE